MRSRSRMSRAEHAPSQMSHLRPMLPVARPDTDDSIGPRRAARILLVNADPFALRRLEAFLVARGYSVIPATTFETASKLLRDASPDMVVAGVRLGAFNGLHLAARSRSLRPSRPTIIIHPSPDPVLDVQARGLGATFIADPLENPEFLPQVRAALDDVASTISPVA